MFLPFSLKKKTQKKQVPGWQNLARSLENDCPTIILDTVTGERVAHWTELDHTTPETHERALMMWPTQQFVESRRYIVVIRNLKNENNQAITSSPAFAALRDGTPTQDPDIENRRDLYAEIFATLGSHFLFIFIFILFSLYFPFLLSF